MSERDGATVERIIANTINETARGDPAALAARIVAALAEAGFRMVTASGRGDTALARQLAETRQLYRSPNGDSWSLARDPATGTAFVRHQANAPSGGQVTDIELGAFLSGPRNPEHDALLRLIGASILDPRGAEAEAEPPAVDTRREWSDGELHELGDMLVRGLSIEEIARGLRRDHREVRDKVAEVGRAAGEQVRGPYPPSRGDRRRPGSAVQFRADCSGSARPALGTAHRVEAQEHWDSARHMIARCRLAAGTQPGHRMRRSPVSC